MIAQAQSGTGKTGAFLISTIQNLDLTNDYTEAIVVSPTRELSIQTYDVCNDISTCLIDKKSPSIGQLFVGGNFRKDDIAKLKKVVKIAIGTPGRLIDLIKKSTP